MLAEINSNEKRVGSIIVAMSGLPIDIVDTGAGSFYGLSGGGNPLARPNWAPGRRAARIAANTSPNKLPTIGQGMF